MKSNLMDVEAAKAAAKRIYQKVNFSGGNLQSYEISSLLTDTYEYLKIPFKPSSRDIKAYTQILDANQDGQVSLQDLQTRAVEYLCGEGILTQQSSQPASKKELYSGSNYQNTSYTKQTNSNTNWNPVSEKLSEKSLTNGSSFNQSSTTYKQSSSSQKEYNQDTLYYLSLTNPIFQHYATERNTITSDRVAPLLSDTYQVLGRQGYQPSEQDVKVWMKLCDSNNDGHVQIDEYIKFVVGSLQRSGLNVYK